MFAEPLTWLFALTVLCLALAAVARIFAKLFKWLLILCLLGFAVSQVPQDKVCKVLDKHLESPSKDWVCR